MNNDANQLVQQIRDLCLDRSVAGISIVTDYRAVSTTVTPPAGTICGNGGRIGYRAEGKGDSSGEFVFDALFEVPDGRGGSRKAVTLDSWGSQANRFEAALLRHRAELGLPVIELVGVDKDGEPLNYGNSLLWSHRHADAVYRLCTPELESAGVPVGEIREATPHNADALLDWFPQSLLFGWWDSHVKLNATEDKAKAACWKKAGGDPAEYQGRIQPTSVHSDDRRSARAVTSEIVAKGVAVRTRYAARVDSVFGPVKGGSKGANGKSEGLAAFGFGSIPPTAAPKDVTFEDIEGRTWLSLTRLRQFGLDGTDEQVLAKQTVLVLLALSAIVGAKDDVHLRSGADLIVNHQAVRIERHGQSPSDFQLPDLETLSAALAYARAVSGVHWRANLDPIDVSGVKSLAAIAASRDAEESA